MDDGATLRRTAVDAEHLQGRIRKVGRILAKGTAPSEPANTPIPTVRASEPPATSAARTCVLGRRPGHSSAAQASGPEMIGSQIVQR